VVFVSITEETGIQLLTLGDSYGRVPSWPTNETLAQWSQLWRNRSAWKENHFVTSWNFSRARWVLAAAVRVSCVRKCLHAKQIVKETILTNVTLTAKLVVTK
jgi:hypothetical protein